MKNNKKNLQFTFEITLDTLEAEYTSAFNFKLLLKRGNKQFETKNTMKYEVGSRRQVKINEIFNLNANLNFQDDSLNELEEKVYKIYLQVYTKNGFKNATYTEVDLSKLIPFDSNGLPIQNLDQINPYEYKDKLELDFMKHPFNFLKLKVSYVAKYIEKINFNEISYDLKNINNSTNIKDRERNSNVGIINNEDQNYVETLKIPRKNSFFNNSKVEIDNKKEEDSNSEEVFLLNEQIKVLKDKIDSLEKEKIGLTNLIDQNLKETVETTKGNTSLNSSRCYDKETNKNDKRLTEELRDKEKIINDLKNENEYFGEENSQLKSIIQELKNEKSKLYEEKTNIIKSQQNEIEDLRKKYENLNKLNNQNFNFSEKVKLQVEELNNQIENLKNSNSILQNSLKDKEETYKIQIEQLKEKYIGEFKNLESSKNKEIETLKKNHQSQLEGKQTDLDNLIDRHELDKIELKNEIKLLVEKLKISNDTKTELESTIQNLEEEKLSILNKESYNNEIINQEISLKLKDLESKNEIIKEKSNELSALQKRFSELEEKFKFNEIEKDSNRERFAINEKKYKEDIINMREILSQKDQELQELYNEKENLKYENDKTKLEIKNLMESKSNDEIFIHQIQELQSKFSEKEMKMNEEKNNIIMNYKKEIDNLNTQIKKASQTNEKDSKLIQLENQKLKEEVKYLKDEVESGKDLKEKNFRLEKNLGELQNTFAMKKIELTQSQMECDKYREELSKINSDYQTQQRDHLETVQLLENELILTKQKLGDTLNELSEQINLYNNSTMTSRGDEGKKKGLFSLFSKKNKNKEDKVSNNGINK